MPGGMIFVLLIGEIDLSIGFIGGVAGVVAAEMVFGDSDLPWWLAVGCSLGCRRDNSHIAAKSGNPTY